MKVIFLDIDGVLNGAKCRDFFENYVFVQDDKIALLAELVERTNAKLVLSSTWRFGWWCRDNVSAPSESQQRDIWMLEALEKKLAAHGLVLMDYTPDFGLRGEEIAAWLKSWAGEFIEAYVILDDMDGRELRPCSRYLVQTSMWDGLERKHVERAVKVLGDRKHFMEVRGMNENKTFPIVEYNDAGLETYREEANGYWVKREYDEQGRQVYWETNRGGWARHKFDDAGNEIYYENSEGFWFKSEYSENGFRTYYEDSNGKILGVKRENELVVQNVLNDAKAKASESSASAGKSVKREAERDGSEAELRK